MLFWFHLTLILMAGDITILKAAVCGCALECNNLVSQMHVTRPAYGAEPCPGLGAPKSCGALQDHGCGGEGFWFLRVCPINVFAAWPSSCANSDSTSFKLWHNLKKQASVSGKVMHAMLCVCCAVPGTSQLYMLLVCESSSCCFSKQPHLSQIHQAIL